MVRLIELLAISALVFLGACSNTHYNEDGSVSSISNINESIILHPTSDDPFKLQTINGEIKVGKGYTLGDVRSVNGEIQLGQDNTAKVVSTVNGDIGINKGSQVELVRSVNGNLRVSGVKVSGDVTSVNGRIKALDNSQIAGNVRTTNGKIFLRDAKVHQNVQMSDGNIELRDTLIEGDVVVTEKRIWEYLSLDFDFFRPKIIVGPNTIITGKIKSNRRIKLFVHESAQIAGIEGAEARYYSSDTP